MLTFRDVGLAVVKALPVTERWARDLYRRMPSQLHDTPTTRMRAFFRNAAEVRFLQIGAFDGLAGDPVRELIVESLTWHGVLVEPQPDVFKRLKANYIGQKARLTLLNCAISNKTGRLDFYMITAKEIERAGLPAWAGEIASLDKSGIEKEFPGIPFVTIQVDCLTVESALAVAGLDTVDCIVMDVEGHELEILRSIDLSTLGVSFLCLEHKHLNAGDRAELCRILDRHRFTLKQFGRDIVAWRR